MTSSPNLPRSSHDGDSFTMEARLCDDDGIVRCGAMHHGTDYQCTGHAHFAGEHIKCISQAHPDGVPTEMLRLIRDPDLDLGDGLTPPPRTAVGLKARRWLAEIEGSDVLASSTTRNAPSVDVEPRWKGSAGPEERL